MEVKLPCMYVSEQLKRFRVCVKTLKIIAGVGGHQLHKIWKQLEKFIVW